MTTFSFTRLSSLVITTAVLLTAAIASACEPANTGQPATNTTSQTTAPGGPAGTNTATTAPGTVEPPLGMEDTVEGRVVGLICYKENPKATPEQLEACAKANLPKGGYLGVLASDGSLYINADTEVLKNNSQLEPFVGQEVTVQGQALGEAPDLSWSGVTVKKFKMKIVRRKGPPPAGTEKNMKNTGQPAGAPAAPATKKP